MSWACVSFNVTHITGRIKENTTCAPESFSHLPSSLKSLLIDHRTLVATLLVPTQKRRSEQQSKGCTKLVSLLVAFLIQTLGRQQTSLKTGPDLQTGTSVPFSRESPTAVIHCCFFIAKALMLHLLQGVAWSDLGGRTCTNSSSIFSHPLSTTIQSLTAIL